MKKIFLLVLLMIISGCENNFYTDYDSYSSEVEDYYRIINEEGTLSLIEVNNYRKRLTKEFVAYYLMEVPGELCGVVMESPNPNDPNNPIVETLPCFSKLHIKLKEKNANYSYYILENGNFYSMEEFGNIASEDEIKKLFSVIQDAEFYKYSMD